MQEPAQAPPPPPALPNAQTLREQIREQVEAARALAQDAGAAAGATAPPAPGELTPTVVVRDMPFDTIPPQVVDITLMFFLTVFAIIVGFPIARAVARWIDRRGQTTRLPADVTTQLNQIAQSVDAMAIEVERISEGQRFTTKLLADQHESRRALAQGGDAAAR
jgi:hypothetical protein